MENFFFDLKKLKLYGTNSIIGKTVRIRHPELAEIGNNSIIDDFTYISTRLIIRNYIHLAPNITVGGGKEYLFKIDSFSGVSSGVRIYCSSNNFDESIISAAIPKKYQVNTSGDIIMNKFTGIGSNSVILPNVVFEEGAVLGACSVVFPNQRLQKWTLYAGIPAKPIKRRNKDLILEKYNQFKHEIDS